MPDLAMQIIITKGERGDRIDVVRADGTRVGTTFPHKGPIPHDAVHFFVESELGLDRGFWGMIAAGLHPEDVQEISKAGGHASATRGRVPDEDIVQMIQAERAVECFEADLWSGGTSGPETMRHAMEAACSQSQVPTLRLDDDSISNVRAHLCDLRARWSALPQGEAVTLDWSSPNA